LEGFNSGVKGLIKQQIHGSYCYDVNKNMTIQEK